MFSDDNRCPEEDKNPICCEICIFLTNEVGLYVKEQTEFMSFINRYL